MRRVVKIAAMAAGLALLLVAGLCLFNLAMVAIGRARYPPLGKLYTVEGRAMHLYCIGAGDDVLYWQTIQPGLAKITRVCAYDRAGIGWSESDPRTRDAESIARQLHELLDAAGVARPLVMAGASAGGFYVREYAREYPDEVAAVALLDSSSPRQVDELPGSRAWYDGERRKRPRELVWEKLKVWTGWQRLMGRCHEDVPPQLAAFRAAFDAEDCRPAYVGSDLGEFLNFETSGREAERLTSFDARPLLVISQDPNRPQNGWTADAIAAQPIWNREQEALKSLSTRSWRVVARGSAHHTHHDRPDVVVREMERLVSFVRGGPAPLLGSTSVE